VTTQIRQGQLFEKREQADDQGATR
jgi:hypothetical protein